jgi:WD40 repeat protein
VLEHPGLVYWVTISRDGKRAATAAAGPDEILIWDLETGKALLRLPHEGRVKALEFSPDGRLVATVSERDVQIWGIEVKK